MHRRDENNKRDSEERNHPMMPATDNPSAHQPTSAADVATGYRRHTGPGGAPGPPGNGPASPLATTPVLYEESGDPMPGAEPLNERRDDRD